MSVTINCQCGKTYLLKDEFAGRDVECPNCGTVNRAERTVAQPQSDAVYGASAVAGSAASLALGPGPSVGASGAIFGLMGAIVAFLHRHRKAYHLRDGRIGFVVAAWAAYTFFLGAVSPMVDNGAHLGGLVGGALAVLATRPRAALSPTRAS